jgi:spermidine synthase
MREKTVSLAIFVKGFSSIIAQTLLARELLVIFYGNELTFGIILCLWLACGAVGSGWLGSLFKKSSNPLRPFCFFQFILSLWFPLAIILVRTSRGLLGLSFADIFGINHIVIIAFISLSFIALSDGAMFSIGFQLIPSVAKIYILESCGIIVGAVLFTFVFLTRLDSFGTAFLVSGLSLLCCCLLLKSEKMRAVQWGPWIFLAASLCLFTQSAKLQRETLAKQWQKKDIVINENSVYGNIAVSREADQFTIYYNGLLAASLPSPEAYFTEDFIHLPMLTQSHVQKVLFIGTAVGGLLTEVLKYPLGKIVYVEMDPLFIKVLHSLKDPATEKELSNPRVAIELTDGRSYIKKTPECFDVVFVNTGLATSLAINRYYTRDFFRETRRVLAKKGIAVFKTWGSLATLSPELAAVNASLYKTLKSVFPCVEVIPGDGFNIFIASDEKINLNPGFLDANWKDLKLKTALINPVYIRLRLQESYRNWFYASLKNELSRASLNQDLRPIGLYEGLRLYYTQFSKKIPKIFISFKKIRPGYLAALLILFFGFWQLLLQGKILAASSTLKLAVAGTGFFAMSVQLIVLFLFQSFLGYLFQWLAILTMSFMLGASAGAFLAYKKLKTFNCRKLGWMEIGVSLASGMFIFYEIAVFKNLINPALTTPWLFSAISICAGFLVGFEIPVAYGLLTIEITLSRKDSRGLAGKLYSLDLVGACIGALLTPLVLIPGCGIMATTLLLCFLKCATGWTLATIPKKNRYSSIAP